MSTGAPALYTTPTHPCQKATSPQLSPAPATEIQSQTSLHSWTHYENEMKHSHS